MKVIFELVKEIINYGKMIELVVKKRIRLPLF